MEEKIARFAVYPEFKIKAASLLKTDASFFSSDSVAAVFPERRRDPVAPSGRH